MKFTATTITDILTRLQSFDFAGKRCTVEIMPEKSKRSIDQNRLYWLWLNCIEVETGQDKDSLHDYFKFRFLGEKTGYALNHIYSRVISTTELDTAQFTVYLEKIRIFVQDELNIYLPLPEMQGFEQFIEQYNL